MVRRAAAVKLGEFAKAVEVEHLKIDTCHLLQDYKHRVLGEPSDRQIMERTLHGG